MNINIRVNVMIISIKRNIQDLRLDTVIQVNYDSTSSRSLQLMKQDSNDSTSSTDSIQWKQVEQSRYDQTNETI